MSHPPPIPLISSAPMLNLSLPRLATSISLSGGLGFLAGGLNLSALSQNLSQSKTLLRGTHLDLDPTRAETGSETEPLPIGLGVIVWGCELELLLDAIKKYPPTAVWLFAPKDTYQLREFADGVRDATEGRSKVWVQICSVAEAMEVTDPESGVWPDVLVVQGGDAGGHGMKGGGAGVISLLPEVRDGLGAAGRKTKTKGGKGEEIPLVAAGGIVDGRGVVASLALGAAGVVMGTRFLACKETSIAGGYQREVLRASDGGVSTVRTTVYDKVRGIYGWPAGYDGRGVINRSYVDEILEGRVGEEENRRLYLEEMGKGDQGWGPDGRMTTYAGTGVGLVKEVMSAREIVESVTKEAKEILGRLAKVDV